MKDRYPQDLRDACCDAALPLIANGKTVLTVAKSLGVLRSELWNWLTATPDRAEMFAQARELGWDALAEELFEMSQDPTLNAKDRRVRLDGGLKMLARWCPHRYGEAVLLKHEVETTGEELTSEQMVAALAEILGKPVPALAAPIDAEYTDVS